MISDFKTWCIIMASCVVFEPTDQTSWLSRSVLNVTGSWNISWLSLVRDPVIEVTHILSDNNDANQKDDYFEDIIVTLSAGN